MDTATGKVLRRWQEADGAMQFTPDGKWLVARTKRTLRVWEVDTGRALRPFALDNDFRAYAFSADGSRLAISSDGTVLIWNLRTLGRAPEYPLSESEWQVRWHRLGTWNVQPDEKSDSLGILHAAGIDRIRKRLGLIDKTLARQLAKTACGEGADARRAAAQLVELGIGALSPIDEMLAGKIDDEAKVRLFALRAKLPRPDPEAETRRAPLIVTLLRQMMTKEAE